MEITLRLAFALKARQPGLHVATLEEERAMAALKAVANHTIPLFRWSSASGIVKINDDCEEITAAQAPFEQALTMVREQTGPIIMALCDPWPELQAPVYQRMLRETLDICRRKGRTIVLIGKTWRIPDELHDDITVIELGLPTQAQLQQQIDSICQQFSNHEQLKGKVQIKTDCIPALARACCGLTLEEATSVVRGSLVEHKAIDERTIQLAIHEKKSIIEKDGVLRYWEPRKLDEVGGLSVAKNYLTCKKLASTDEARKAGIDAPKGAVFLGPPGTGKSLIAKAAASLWQVPLVQLSMAQLMSGAGVVGEAEGRFTKSLKTIEAVSPCILWVDEIEKAFENTNDSNGIQGRIFGELLNWMQESKSEVYTIATANSVHGLKPELLSRFDDVFFVDLPCKAERKEIWKIHLARRGKFSDSDLTTLAAQSTGYVGREMEKVCREAHESAFAERKPLNLALVLSILKLKVPISKQKQQEIKALREWAKSGMARPASTGSIEADTHEQAAVPEV